MKLDMHVHTKYSKDSFTRIGSLKKYCRKNHIIPIITDHDSIRGNLAYGCPILASEISSSDGHIIGYFLTERIPAKLSAFETIDRIHEQGGLACIPHPFDSLRKSSLMNASLIKKADLMEGFNARIQNQSHNSLAQDFAKKNKMPITVGTDSHFQSEVGKSYIEVEPFDSVKSFVHSIMKGNIFFKPQSIVYPLCTWAYKKSLGKLK